MEKLYCGIYLTYKNGYTSYAVNKINNLISFISSERSVKRALDNKAEVFSLFYMPDNSFVVCHIYDGKISFSKISDGQLTNILYNDIDYLSDVAILNDFSRMVNKSAHYTLNQIQRNSDFLSDRLIKRIQEKDFSEENKEFIKDYDLTDYKDGTPLNNIKANYVLSDKLQEITKGKSKNLLTSQIKEETISCSLKDIDSKENAPDICEIIKQSQEKAKNLPVSEPSESKSRNFDMSQVKKGTANFSIGESKNAKSEKGASPAKSAGRGRSK